MCTQPIAHRTGAPTTNTCDQRASRARVQRQRAPRVVGPPQEQGNLPGARPTLNIDALSPEPQRERPAPRPRSDEPECGRPVHIPRWPRSGHASNRHGSQRAQRCPLQSPQVLYTSIDAVPSGPKRAHPALRPRSDQTGRASYRRVPARHTCTVRPSTVRPSSAPAEVYVRTAPSASVPTRAARKAARARRDLLLYGTLTTPCTALTDRE